jgi:hypothetical protein
MKKIAAQINWFINDYPEKIRSIPETEFAAKPDPKKWSKKEILGHLIDSAQTNIRRFVTAQYEEEPFIIYDQDKWVAISNHQHRTIEDLLALWILLNRHISIILANTGDQSALRICKTNNQTPHSIEWLAEDYLKHLLHHLHQVCNMEPVPYP